LHRATIALAVLNDFEFNVGPFVEEGVQPTNTFGFDLRFVELRRRVTLDLQDLLVRKFEFADFVYELDDQSRLPGGGNR
jgi:hypothetical protein